MTAATVVGSERRELADLLLELGPDEPTLCGDWDTRDLLAHLVVRETRPDSVPGILLGGPFATWTARLQGRVADRDFGDLVGAARTGPPRWSPQGLPFLQPVEVQEWFIHHEDVRRAQSEWSPRPPEGERDGILWSNVALIGRLSYRKSPVGVVLRRPDGAEHTVKRGERSVVLTGEPGELLLHAAGREQCVVSPEGEPADVAAVQGLDRGL